MEEFDPIAYINEPRWQKVRPGLERITELLERMGRPQDHLKFVHVAGTNGKGSTCAYIASILQEGGYRTGLFTSPYIIEFEERIRVNGENHLCGLAEFYGLNDDLHKISIGYRLLERYWRQGIATQTVSLMVGYLFGQTDIQIITARTMVENIASARALEKNGFIRTAPGVEDDWGYETPTIAEKWLRLRWPRPGN